MSQHAKFLFCFTLFCRRHHHHHRRYLDAEVAVKAVAVLELLFKVSGGKNPIKYLNIMEMSQIIKMEYRIEFKKMNCLETNKKIIKIIG